jgi:hypothetical protein
LPRCSMMLMMLTVPTALRYSLAPTTTSDADRVLIVRVCIYIYIHIYVALCVSLSLSSFAYVSGLLQGLCCIFGG